jgi:hypothetical protein
VKVSTDTDIPEEVSSPILEISFVYTKSKSGGTGKYRRRNKTLGFR